MATITTLGFTIFSTYDGRGTTAARRDINSLTDAANRNNKAMEGGVSGMRAMMAGALALAPALVPVGSGLLAGAAGFTAIASAAGAAGGIWAMATIGAAKETTKMGKELDKANKNLDAQKAALKGLTPGTQAYKDQLLKVHDAQGKVNEIMGKMSKTQVQFLHQTDALKNAWKAFIAQTSPATLGPLNVIMKAVTDNMGKLKPLVTAVGKVAMEAAKAFANWAGNGGLDRFVQTLVKYGVPALHQLLDISRNVMRVLGDGFRAFAPLGEKVFGAIAKGAKDLAAWSAGGGFQRFMAYVVANGPAIKEFFTALGGAIVTLSKSIGEMSGTSLKLSTILLNLIAKLPPSLITALTYAWIAWTVAVEAWAVATTIAAAAQVALDIAASPFFLLMAGAALTILLVVAAVAALGVGLYFLVTKWDTVKAALVTAWNATWNALKIAAEAVWNAIKIAWSAVVQFFTTIWNTYGGALKAAWEAVWNALKIAGEAVWNAIKLAWQAVATAFTTVWNTTSAALKAAWSAVWTAMKTAGEAVWNAIKLAWQAVGTALTTVWNTVSGALKAAWTATWNAMKTAGEAVWNAIKAAWQAVGTALTTVWNTVSGALKAAWSAAWNAMKTAGEAVWNAMKAAWQAFGTALTSVWNTVSSALKTAWSAAWNAMKTAAETIWNAIKAAWQTAMNAIHTVFTTVSNVIKGVWKTFWDGLHTVAKGVWDTIQKGWDNLSSGIQKTLSGLVDKAKEIWNKIVDVFKTPVNLVIGIWDKVAGAVGLPEIKQLAAGGEVGGTGHSTSDNIPALLSPGEFVMPASAVRRYGVDTMEDMRRHRFAAGGMVPGYALGGVVTEVPVPGGGTAGQTPGDDVNKPSGSVIGALGGAVGAAIDGIKDIVGDVVYNIAKPIIDKIMSGIPHPIPGVATPAGDVPWAAAKKITDAALDILKKKQEEAKAIGGVIPAGQHKAIIDAALKAAGVPPPGTLAEWEAGLNTLITRESAWNSGAINNTDSNAAAGHPSQGLAQTIPSTFAAYHVPGTSNNILDPVANVAAAIRYIVARYGNITNVQQANANAAPQGYWRGTGNAVSGWKLYGENGPELVHSKGGERVLDAGRTRRALAGGHGHHGGNEFHEGAFHFDLRGASKETVQYVEGELCDKLRMAVQAGTGKRGY